LSREKEEMEVELKDLIAKHGLKKVYMELKKKMDEEYSFLQSFYEGTAAAAAAPQLREKKKPRVVQKETSVVVESSADPTVKVIRLN